MLRRTFCSLFGLIPFVPKPACSDGPRAAIKTEDGRWEAPGFYGTFICMKCGGKTGANNVTTCGCTHKTSEGMKRCNESHWAVGSISISDGLLSFYHKAPNKNCIMARGVTIAVPDGENLVLYQRDKDKGNPEIVARIHIKTMLDYCRASSQVWFVK